ncbi:MAG TPA: hypothetical protein VJU61_15920 [Polyangiaceae bacterium]|nr:hypothetical protein [Polyangiaceae bacterium]
MKALPARNTLALWVASIACGGGAATLLEIPVASACTIAVPPPALVGYPGEGALGVPTDVRPIYDLSRIYTAVQLSTEVEVANGLATSPLELVDDAGVVTPLDLGSGSSWHIELVPPGALAPRTHYVVRSIASRSRNGGLELSFTTGDGPRTTLPEVPSAGVAHYSLASDTPSSCSPWEHGTCLHFPIPAEDSGVFVEATPFDSIDGFQSAYVYLSATPWFMDLSGIDQGTPFDCVRLRSRAPNGTFSEATTLCREDGVLYDLRGSEDIDCTAEGLTHKGQLVSEPTEVSFSSSAPAEAGCNMARSTGSRTGSLPVTWLLLLLPLGRTRARLARQERVARQA